MEEELLELSCKRKKGKNYLPLATERISAGFPSPADDYIDTGIDLNEELIKHPTSTFFLRVNGHSMINAGIYDRDLLIVDRSFDPQPGHIVIALVDGAFTLKRFIHHNGIPYLKAESPNYPPLNISHYDNVQIWGVAIYSIHALNRSLK